MPEAFWNNLPATIAATVAAITAIIGAITTAAAWFDRRSQDRKAEKKLQENTDLTAKVDRQTNGMSEKQQKLLERLADQIEGNTTSVKAIGLRVARLEDRLDRIDPVKGDAKP